jgi:hypothetical protein
MKMKNVFFRFQTKVIIIGMAVEQLIQDKVLGWLIQDKMLANTPSVPNYKSFWFSRAPASKLAWLFVFQACAMN